MGSRVILPRVRGFRLHAFEPIFGRDVVMNLRPGPNIILGGNGLGKTTIMQAVVYGLAGGAGEKVEENKSQRWDHGYFRQRLLSENAQTALVEVDFSFGREVFSVRRGFSGSDVTGFKPDGSPWLEDRSEAKEAFEQTLGDFGGYRSPDDFSFVVHRLSYLPENRRLIAWDTDAQIRLLMLLNQDVLDEADFRTRRDELRLMDSRKRHIHVAVGKAASQLASLLEYRGEDVHEEEPVEGPPASAARELEVIVERLRELGNQRRGLEEKGRTANANLTETSKEIEALRDRVDLTEASLVARFLSEQERESVLPVYKLAELGICPVCGTNQPDLQALAQEHYRAHRCVLCGSEEPKSPNQEIVALRSQLSAKLQAQQALEESVRTLNVAIEGLRREEDARQAVINKVRFSQPVVTLPAQGLPQSTRDQLEPTRLACA